MKVKLAPEQEKAWSCVVGDQSVERNIALAHIPSLHDFFSSVLRLINARRNRAFPQIYITWFLREEIRS